MIWLEEKETYFLFYTKILVSTIYGELFWIDGEIGNDWIKSLTFKDNLLWYGTKAFNSWLKLVNNLTM